MQSNSRLGDVSRWVLEYLDQAPHDTHNAEDVITGVSTKIASGRALRRYELRTKNLKGTSNRPPLTQEEQAASGRRDIINDALNTLKEGGYLTLEKKGDVRCVRRVMACPECHRPFPLTSSTTTEKVVTTGNVISPTSAPWWRPTGTESDQ